MAGLSSSLFAFHSMRQLASPPSQLCGRQPVAAGSDVLRGDGVGLTGASPASSQEFHLSQWHPGCKGRMSSSNPNHSQFCFLLPLRGRGRGTEKTWHHRALSILSKWHLLENGEGSPVGEPFQAGKCRGAKQGPQEGALDEAWL